MNYWRCKCGELQAHESGYPPAPCEVCPKCGSTLAMSPGTHGDPVPHEWVTKYDSNTGAPYRECSRCFKREPTPTHEEVDDAE